jgi:hypothetical protein
MAGHSYKLFTGRITGITTTAQALAVEPQASIREVVVQADPANTTNVLVGNSAAQNLVLVPGQGLSIPITNLVAIYIKMASGTGAVNWLARD